jgi:uncharacterized protein YllA (UPF0747 family)
LYTFGEKGQRVRVQRPAEHVERAAEEPGRYSTDAALRPLLADTVFPVVASVLGPGEIAYQGMLRPLYRLFDLPQPLLYPRQSYTIVSGREAERLAAYGISTQEMLTEQVDSTAVLSNLLPNAERALFSEARRGIEDVLSPLRSYVKEIDPSLARTWRQTVRRSQWNLDKLEQRATKARVGQMGFSKLELRRLHNALLPRDRLQERVLPFTHFYTRHGPGLVDLLLSAGELGEFAHQVLTVEE